MHGQWEKYRDFCVFDDECEATLTSWVGDDFLPCEVGMFLPLSPRKLRLREVKSLVGGGTLGLLGSRAAFL